jgi:GTP cyclohydrolase II
MNAYAVAGVTTEFVCLSLGDLAQGPPPLVRLHSECLTGDVLGSLRCDCGQQLDGSLEMLATEGRGLLMYLRQEGRGIGLVDKIRAYGLQDGGLDTIDANLALGLPVDSREYHSAATVLHHLGLKRVRLITNNLKKCEALEAAGIQVVERVPIEVPPNPSNIGYLRTKAKRLGHLIEFDAVDEPEEKTA